MAVRRSAGPGLRVDPRRERGRLGRAVGDEHDAAFHRAIPSRTSASNGVLELVEPSVRLARPRERLGCDAIRLAREDNDLLLRIEEAHEGRRVARRDHDHLLRHRTEEIAKGGQRADVQARVGFLEPRERRRRAVDVGAARRTI
jgi:hypothetical protein